MVKSCSLHLHSPCRGKATKTWKPSGASTAQVSQAEKESLPWQEYLGICKNKRRWEMLLATYTPIPTFTPTKPSSVLFQGDVSPSVQRQIVEFSDFRLKNVDFARTTGHWLILKEASVFKRAEDAKLQSRLVYEIAVAQDMTNQQHTLHGGCTAFLVDVCSSVGLAFLAMVQGKPSDFVSQTIITTYHASAPVS